MKSHIFWKRQALAIIGALSLALSSLPLAYATDIPAGVLNYLRQKDPRVKVRFDGLVLFSNGQSYVPVIPQDPSLNVDPQQVIATLPEKANYPDLIQFDNNFFLMRLVQTSSGRLTFPKMTEYPIQLKEGLLPQDFVMPKNLFIPVELKVILGALPYNPSYTPTNTPAIVPVLAGFSADQLKNTARQTYVFDLNQQKILGIDPITGNKTGEVALNCSPSGMQMSPDGKLLFIPCLSTNELVVVDTSANLVKTRVPVGQRPDAVLYVNPLNDVVISNRYSSFLSVISGEDLVSGQKIELPGNGGAMVQIPGEKVPKLLVADAFKPKIYVVNLNTGLIEKTIEALPEISALKILQPEKGPMEIWAISRTKDQLRVLDFAGKELKTLDVGNKPVEMSVYENKVLVLSAGDSQIRLIDRARKELISSVALEPEGFPSGMVTVPSEKRTYVTMAAMNRLVILNPESGTIETSLPVEFRASMIAMPPEKADVEKFASAAGATTERQHVQSAPQTAQDTKQKPNKMAKPGVQPSKEALTPAKQENIGTSTVSVEKTVNAKPSKAVTTPKRQTIAPATESPAALQSNNMTSGGKFRLSLPIGKSVKHSEKMEKTTQTTEKSNSTAGVTKESGHSQAETSSKNQSTQDSMTETEMAVPVKAGVRLEKKPLETPAE